MPRVKDGHENGFTCSTTVNRLKKGPANIPEIIQWNADNGYQYLDRSFTGSSMLYQAGYLNDAWSVNYWQDELSDGNFFFGRWTEVFPDVTIYGSGETTLMTDVRQGGAGTCYIMSAISTVAEYPQILQETILTETKNAAGVYGFQFYIRGKPWVLTTDDTMLFENPSSPNLHFSFLDNGGSVIWPALLEKAFAKIKGSYDQANGGFIETGIRALTGAPVFTYYSEDIINDQTLWGYSQSNALWDIFAAAEVNGYMLGAGTSGEGDDSATNGCGIAKSHAYSIMSAFELTSGGVTEKVLLVRNPWGVTYYTGEWNKDDSRWTSTTIAMVPNNVNPTADFDQGYFVVPIKLATSMCFADFNVAHERSAEGFTDDWFDADDMNDDLEHDYHVTVPAKDGDLYFTVESYYLGMVPDGCIGGYITYSATERYWYDYPVVYFELFKSSDLVNPIDAAYYVEYYHTPLMVAEADYEAGDEFVMKITYHWLGSPVPDYTVKVHSKQALVVTDESGAENMIHMDGQQPSGFTVSNYTGMTSTDFTPAPEPIVNPDPVDPVEPTDPEDPVEPEDPAPTPWGPNNSTDDEADTYIDWYDYYSYYDDQWDWYYYYDFHYEYSCDDTNCTYWTCEEEIDVCSYLTCTNDDADCSFYFCTGNTTDNCTYPDMTDFYDYYEQDYYYNWEDWEAYTYQEWYEWYSYDADVYDMGYYAEEWYEYYNFDWAEWFDYYYDFEWEDFYYEYYYLEHHYDYYCDEQDVNCTFTYCESTRDEVVNYCTYTTCDAETCDLLWCEGEGKDDCTSWDDFMYDYYGEYNSTIDWYDYYDWEQYFNCTDGDNCTDWYDYYVQCEGEDCSWWNYFYYDELYYNYTYYVYHTPYQYGSYPVDLVLPEVPANEKIVEATSFTDLMEKCETFEQFWFNFWKDPNVLFRGLFGSADDAPSDDPALQLEAA